MDARTDPSGGHCHRTSFRHNHTCYVPVPWAPRPDWRELVANAGALLVVA